MLKHIPVIETNLSTAKANISKIYELIKSWIIQHESFKKQPKNNVIRTNQYKFDFMK